MAIASSLSTHNYFDKSRWLEIVGPQYNGLCSTVTLQDAIDTHVKLASRRVKRPAKDNGQGPIVAAREQRLSPKERQTEEAGFNGHAITDSATAECIVDRQRSGQPGMEESSRN